MLKLRSPQPPLPAGGRSEEAGKSRKKRGRKPGESASARTKLAGFEEGLVGSAKS